MIHPLFDTTVCWNLHVSCADTCLPPSTLCRRRGGGEGGVRGHWWRRLDQVKPPQQWQVPSASADKTLHWSEEWKDTFDWTFLSPPLMKVIFFCVEQRRDFSSLLGSSQMWCVLRRRMGVFRLSQSGVRFPGQHNNHVMNETTVVVWLPDTAPPCEPMWLPVSAEACLWPPCLPSLPSDDLVWRTPSHS